jgi:hypothetical protein
MQQMWASRQGARRIGARSSFAGVFHCAAPKDKLRHDGIQFLPKR